MRKLMISLALWLACGSLWADEVTVWLGTTGTHGGDSQGIYRATLNTDSGELTTPELAYEISNPGFLVLHPSLPLLYSVCSSLDRKDGKVAVFEISADGELTLINKQETGDGRACHLAVDPSGRCLFTSQYSGGSVTVFPLGKDGSIGERSQLVRHTGSGPLPRQSQPHPHWVGVDPGNQFLFVPDLGTDKIEIYRVDHGQAKISSHGHAKSLPGSGPRHMKFHANGKFAYLLNEIELAIKVYRLDAKAGTLSEIQTISTLPTEMRDRGSSASEIRIHPSGRFVYAANRGDDTIAVFAVNEETGKLTFVEHENVRGSWPRNFNIDPTGKWLLCASRDTNSIAVFSIDQQTGGLVFTGKVVPCPRTICVEMRR